MNINFSSQIFQDLWTQSDPWVKIKPANHIYLKTKSNFHCREESCYEFYASKIIHTNFTSCEALCIPASINSLLDSSLKNIPLCKTPKEINCILGIAYNNFSASICPKPCSILEYSGKVDYWDPKSETKTLNTTFMLTLRFIPPGE